MNTEAATAAPFAGRRGRIFRGFVALMWGGDRPEVAPWYFSDVRAETKDFMDDCRDKGEKACVVPCEMFIPLDEGSPTAIQSAASEGITMREFLDVLGAVEVYHEPQEGVLSLRDGAAALGRRGGMIGGRVKASRVTADERSEMARDMATARWHPAPGELPPGPERFRAAQSKKGPA